MPDLNRHHDINEGSTADDMRRALGGTPNLQTRLDVARNPKIPDDIAMSLVRDFNPDVRGALLDNPILLKSAIGQRILKMLANDVDDSVYSRAASLRK